MYINIFPFPPLTSPSTFPPLSPLSRSSPPSLLLLSALLFYSTVFPPVIPTVDFFPSLLLAPVFPLPLSRSLCSGTISYRFRNCSRSGKRPSPQPPRSYLNSLPWQSKVQLLSRPLSPGFANCTVDRAEAF